MTAECSKLGAVARVNVFPRHPDGVVQVKFKTDAGATLCIERMNGRFFAGRKLVCELWDGVEDFAAYVLSLSHSLCRVGPALLSAPSCALMCVCFSLLVADVTDASHYNSYLCFAGLWWTQPRWLRKRRPACSPSGTGSRQTATAMTPPDHDGPWERGSPGTPCTSRTCLVNPTTYEMYTRIFRGLSLAE